MNEAEGVEHYACSPACQAHLGAVFQGICDRKSLRDAGLSCPCCGSTLSFFGGGPGSYWAECSCGSYSDLGADIDAVKALCTDVCRWHEVDPSVSMYPPIGG